MKRREFLKGMLATAGAAALLPIASFASIGSSETESSFISTTGAMQVGDIFTIEGIDTSFVVESVHDGGSMIKPFVG